MVLFFFYGLILVLGELMYLSKREERILEGELGEAYRLAMEVVVKVGDVLGAERLINISSAHISGVSYKNIGDEGLEFLRELRDNGGRFTVKTTVNPSGIDIINWKKMNVDKNFALKQLEIIKIFRDMGALTLLSCTPYYYIPVKTGDHLAWAESNAVLYANSVIGAFTNREGGPMAVFEGIIGKAPYIGLHLEKNRIPTVKIDLKELKKEIDIRGEYALLGYYIGYIVKMGVPLILNYPLNLKKPAYLRLFLAAIGASSSIGLVIIEKYSPDYYKIKDMNLDGIDKFTPNIKELKEISMKIQRDMDRVDALVFGCPHLSLEDLRKFAAFFKYNKPRKRVILFTARRLNKISRKYINILKKSGIEIYFDTCMVVANLKNMGIENVIVDSAKAAYYLTSQGYKVHVLNTDEAMRYATKE